MQFFSQKPFVWHKEITFSFCDILKFISASRFLQSEIISVNKVYIFFVIFGVYLQNMFSLSTNSSEGVWIVERVLKNSQMWLNLFLQQNLLILNLSLQIKLISFCYIWYLSSKHIIPLHKYFWRNLNCRKSFKKFNDVIIKFISVTKFLQTLINYLQFRFFFKLNYLSHFSQNYPLKYFCRILYCRNISPYCIR